jgi:RNA polymerase sigma-70 factor, ECF subfamily
MSHVEPEVEALLRAGDYRAVATHALRLHGPTILGLLRKLITNRDLADDAFSFFAEQLWKGMGTFRGEASLRTWCFKLARNAAVTAQREGWNRLRVRLETFEAERLAAEIQTRSAVRVERQSRTLDRLRAHFTMEEQTLLALRIDQRLGWDEIAEVLATEEEPVEAPALRKRFERLKARLEVLARQEGLL